MSKKNVSPVTGFRYFFSILAGVSRGPVDQIFQIMSASVVAWEGEVSNGILNNTTDPSGLDSVFNVLEGATVGASWAGGPIQQTELDVPINKPNLYGGDDREGGIVGTMDVYMGNADQTLGTRITDLMDGIKLSALRGVCTVFFDGQICANNPYPKAWKFRVRRALKGWDGDPWYPERAVIMLSDPAIPGSSFTYNASQTTVTQTNADGSATTTVTNIDGTQTINTYAPTVGLSNATLVPAYRNQIYAMNPAHIIYECCTNRDWGRGLDRALMDEISFTDAANVLADEHFGLCLKWSRSEDIDSFLQTVIDHIGAVMYTDKISGRLCLRLIRNSYVVGDLPVFDYEHGLLSLTTVEDSAQDATANEVIVKYNSPVLNTDKEARAQNIASVSALGNIFSVTRQYPGIPTSTLAVLVAQRDLQAMSAGLKRVEAKFDRRAYLVVPGDVIVINAPSEGLPNAVIRVAQIEDTTLSDGTITIRGAQDRFGLPLVPFTVHQPSTFTEPNLNPYPIEQQSANEATFRDLYKLQGPIFAESVEEYVGYAVLTARAPNPAAFAFLLETRYTIHYSSTITEWKPVITGRFAKASSLAAAITPTTTSFIVTGELRPRNVTVGQALKITDPASPSENEEFVRLDAITVDGSGNTVLTVGRGCVDTPALPHRAGAVVWAYDQTGTGDPTEYTNNDIVGLRGLTKTSRGTLPEDRASVSLLGISGRPFRAYPGGDFRVNGVAPGDGDTSGPWAYPNVTGDLVITWKHRNRLTQADKLIDASMADVSPETDAMYDLFITGGSGGFSVNNITGNTTTITAAAMSSMMGGVTGDTGNFTIFFDCYRNTSGIRLSSRTLHYKRYSYTVPAASGFGNNFGNNFGG